MTNVGEYHGGSHDTGGGYHRYRGGCLIPPHFSCSIRWGDIMILVQGEV